MKGPVGACQYCGQEFMTKQGLAVHETKSCTERPIQEPAELPVTCEGEVFWERNQEAQMGTRAITNIGAGVQVLRPGRG